MSETMLIAIIGMVAKVGFDATISFLKNRGATLDEAIAALEVAASIEKSLQAYKDKDLAERPK